MIIKDAGEIKLRDVYGRESYNGSAKHNAINIENTKISDAYLYGGYLNKYSANNSSDANHNTITITKNSTINGRVYGGYYASGLVKENTVNIDTSTVNDIIYGRYTENGLVVENSVNIDNSTISKNVYGRYSRTSGEINENKIKVTSNSTILGDIYGGRSGNGKVTANEVKLINSTASENIYGGYSKNSKANQNKVFLTNKSHVKGEIYLALGLSTSDNEVTINDLTSDKDIMVGWADKGIANKNKITITNNSKVNALITTGRGVTEVNLNKIIIDKSEIGSVRAAVSHTTAEKMKLK